MDGDLQIGFLMRKKHWLIPLMAAVILFRLFPFLDTGLPFSPDAWPMIGNLKLLLEKTPIYLGSLGEYHNYWPGGILFSSIFKLITGLSPKNAAALAYPLANSLSIIFFYLVSKKITGSQEVALASSALLSFFYPFSLWMAGVGKEAFAIPFLFLLLFIYLKRFSWRFFLIFTISSITIVLSHHFTPFLLITLLTLVAIGSILGEERFEYRKISLIPVLATIFFIYQLIYPGLGSRFDILLKNLTYILVLGLFIIFISIYFSRDGRLGTAIFSLISLLFLLIAFESIFTFSIPQIQLIPPILPDRYILYALPAIITLPFLIIGYKRLRDQERALIPLLWLSLVAGVEILAIFEDNILLLYRGVNFLIPPIALMVAASILKKANTKNLIRAIKFVGIVAIISLCLFNFFAAYGLEEKYMGYQLKQSKYEFQAGGWLAQKNPDQKILVDEKTRYLLEGYFNLKNVNDQQGYFYLRHGGYRGLFFSYRQMRKNGFLWGPKPKELPNNWRDKLQKQPIIYNNGNVKIYNLNPK